jgi:transcriptional regulator with XRE-family HTH domain
MADKIGDRIKRKREKERLSAEDLAIKLGLKSSNIYKWERGSTPSNPEDYNKINAWLNNLEYVPNDPKVNSDLETELANIQATLIKLDATAKIIGTNVAELMAAKRGISVAKAAQELEETIRAEVEQVLRGLNKKQE